MTCEHEIGEESAKGNLKISSAFKSLPRKGLVYNVEYYW